MPLRFVHFGKRASDVRNERSLRLQPSSDLKDRSIADHRRKQGRQCVPRARSKKLVGRANKLEEMPPLRSQHYLSHRAFRGRFHPWRGIEERLEKGARSSEAFAVKRSRSKEASSSACFRTS